MNSLLLLDRDAKEFKILIRAKYPIGNKILTGG